MTRQPLPELGHVLMWLTRPAGKKWSWLYHTLFPPTKFLAYRYGTASTGAPLATRCRRVIGLAQALLILTTRIVRRLLQRPLRAAA